jgi:hypothetical protein
VLESVQHTEYVTELAQRRATPALAVQHMHASSADSASHQTVLVPTSRDRALRQDANVDRPQTQSLPAATRVQVGKHLRLHVRQVAAQRRVRHTPPVGRDAALQKVPNPLLDLDLPLAAVARS